MLSETTITNPPLELDPPVEPIVLLSKMTSEYLGIPAERSFIYNQKWLIPSGPQAFQVFSVVSDLPYASELSYDADPVTGDLQETVMSSCRSMIQWELWSRSAEARLMRIRAIGALHSTACQQLCERNGFSIASAPTAFSDLSYNDGSARINRYSITFAVLTAQADTRTVESYNKYPVPNPSFLINA